MRSAGIKALGVMGLVLQPFDLADLTKLVDKGMRECREHDPTYRGLRRVIFIGTYGSMYHRYLAPLMAPGESMVLLPVKTAWMELDKRRDEVARAVARFGV